MDAAVAQNNSQVNKAKETTQMNEEHRANIVIHRSLNKLYKKLHSIHSGGICFVSDTSVGPGVDILCTWALN